MDTYNLWHAISHRMKTWCRHVDRLGAGQTFRLFYPPTLSAFFSPRNFSCIHRTRFGGLRSSNHRLAEVVIIHECKSFNAVRFFGRQRTMNEFDIRDTSFELFTKRSDLSHQASRNFNCLWFNKSDRNSCISSFRVYFVFLKSIEDVVEIIHYNILCKCNF